LIEIQETHWLVDLTLGHGPQQQTQWKAQRYQTLRHNYTQTSRKNYLIKLTGAKQTLWQYKAANTAQTESDLTVKDHQAQPPTGTSIFVLVVNFSCELCSSSLFLLPVLLSLTLPLAQSPVSSSMWLTAQICRLDLYQRGWLWMVRPWAVERWSSHRYPYIASGHLLTDN